MFINYQTGLIEKTMASAAIKYDGIIRLRILCTGVKCRPLPKNGEMAGVGSLSSYA